MFFLEALAASGAFSADATSDSASETSSVPGADSGLCLASEATATQGEDTLLGMHQECNTSQGLGCTRSNKLRMWVGG